MYFDQNSAFRDHCEAWHQCVVNDQFDQPLFPPPPPPHSENRQWRGYHRRFPVSIFPSNMDQSVARPRQSICWPNENRRQKAEINQKLASVNFPPRKTLLDTFVERNEEYWKNRVTIKIDVSFTDHSHIIGKNGQNTQSIMKETTCHIHFPDANRNPELEKSNMVTISGPMQKVDNARRSVRQLAPLIITLELKRGRQDPTFMAEDPVVKEIIGSGLNLLVRSNRCSGTPYFILRGSVYQTTEIRNAMLRLQQRFLDTTTAICSTSLDVLQNQQVMLLGPDAANIQLIAQRTGATIHYPRGESEAATTFFIQGTIDAILSARSHLIGCLPMAFIFEVEKDQIGATAIDQLQKEFGLSINLRPSRCGNNLVVIVKGPERLATSIYAVRPKIIGGSVLNQRSIVVTDYDFMKDFVSQNIVQTPGSVSTMSTIPTPMNASAFTFPNPFAEFDEELDGPELRKPKSSIWPRGRHTLKSEMKEEKLKEEYVEVGPNTPFVASPLSFFPMGDYRFFNFQWEPLGNGKAGTHASVGMSSHQSAVIIDVGDDSSSGSSPADSDTVSSKDMHVAAANEEAPLVAGILKGAQKIHENASKWKAPGAERDGPTDYEKQQVLATKVMLEPADGVRVPTDCWSGMGFSRSMPGQVVEKEAEDNKIGPWTIVTNGKNEKGFHATNYFDGGNTSAGKLDLSTIKDVSDILSHLRLVKYLDIFREQEIDMDTFTTMTDTDLKELGVNTFGARRKLLVVISEMREIRHRGQ